MTSRERPPADTGLMARVGRQVVVNRRQATLVLVGLLIFVVGAFLGLTPVRGLTDDGSGMALPLLEPVTAFSMQPGPVLLALLALVLGISIALGGCYATRQRR